MATCDSTQRAQPHRFIKASTWKRVAICLLIPWAAVSLVLAMSPNFAITKSVSAFDIHEVRAGSYGGDLLQEYVGGVIWNESRDQLYDWEHSKAIQHDPSIVGFSWQKNTWFPMVYPPYHYQLASLFSAMPYRSFAILYSFAGAVALSISSFSMLQWHRDLKSDSQVWLFAGLLFMPLLLGFSMGQKSAVLLAILTVSFVLLHHARPMSAGMVFGLIAIKPHFAIVIGIAMLCKKQYRFVLGSFISLGLMIALSASGSVSVWQDYIKLCLGMGDFVSNGGYQLTESHSLWGTTQMLIGSTFPSMVKPVAATMIIAAVCLVARILRGPVDTTSPKFAIQFSTCIVATVLVSPHFYTYDLTILLLPLALCTLGRNTSKFVNMEFLVPICASVIFGIGLCRPVAIATGIQPSVILLFAWLAVIAMGKRNVAESDINPNRESQGSEQSGQFAESYTS